MAKKTAEEILKLYEKSLEMGRKKSAALREKKKAEGLKQCTIWASEEEAKFLKEIAEVMRKNPGGPFAFCTSEGGKFMIQLQTPPWTTKKP